MRFTTSIALALALATSAPLAIAAEGHGHAHHGSSPIGQPGTAAEATRTVEVTLYDMYYEPESIAVKSGETVRFVIKNSGELLHEFNIGTAAMHEKHQAQMQLMMDHGMLTPTGVNHEMAHMDHSAMPGMEGLAHQDPNSVLVEPGATVELAWTFPGDAQLEFACNMPGHYGAGMVGEITLD
ncbi:cupredoxin domain-containing protein [Marinobacterium rhizophilum]|uniref:cupredoxin domain-containing protein n=1 Tax=Marinobacterium rhizophilum TaxID=420402 RepID=UPI00036A27B6|nr:plastocyanin/azurin family copper-binding protein [Marinobacterium rhizophilum]